MGHACTWNVSEVSTAIIGAEKLATAPRRIDRKDGPVAGDWNNSGLAGPLLTAGKVGKT